MSLMKNPLLINREDNQFLEKTISEYPFFATSHILLAKGLLNIESFRYNKKLKKAALYSADRKKLFNLITFNKIIKPESNLIEDAQEKSVKEKLDLGKPLEFEKNETHSFSEWLTLLHVKKIDRKEAQKAVSLIDNFLEKKATTLCFR